MTARGLSLAALALALGGCGDPDPCTDANTCVRIDVSSATVDIIDQLEFDILYADQHATVTSVPETGGVFSLPLATAIVLEVTGDAPIPVGIVLAGKLGSLVQGTGAASASVLPGTQAALAIELSPVDDCTPGALYCGGDRLAGDPETLYACNGGGVPLARGVCRAGCAIRPGQDDTCSAADAPCRNGGSYCGGDKLAGDPQTLYVCMAGVGTSPTPCANGCVVRPGSDDACR